MVEVLGVSTFTTPLEIEYEDGRTWKVTQEFDYALSWCPTPNVADKTEPIIRVPAGFVTDFASIPRAFWTILPPTGKYGKAAVVHDFLYVKGGILPPDRFTKNDADRIFYEAMGVLGVNQFVRWTMWKAVSAFGKGAFVA